MPYPKVAPLRPPQRRPLEVAEFALAGGVRLLFSVLSGSDPSLIPDSGSNFVLKPLDLDDEIVGLADLALQRERPKLDV